MPNRSSLPTTRANQGEIVQAKLVRVKAGGGQGRHSAREALVDVIAPSISVVRGKPEPDDFIRQVVNEMKIRGYSPNTIRNYQSHVIALLRWHGGLPHQINRDHVREFLLTIVDSGLSRSMLAGSLAAIRTVFDDLCCRQVTLGLVTPRRKNPLPIILSPKEVQRMIDACTTLRDKMLVSLLYATGMRVSEVVKLQWTHIDFDRNCIRIVEAKGNVDRDVMLPESCRALLGELANSSYPDGYLFPSEGQRSGRHLSARTVQRAIKRLARLAGIGKPVTPHSLRHAFATHLFESGTDIRLIQKYLGHARLDTTCIYTRVSKQSQTSATSPLDRLNGASDDPSVTHPTLARPVGTMRVRTEPIADQSGFAVEVHVTAGGQSVVLDDIIACQPRPGWVALELPMLDRWQPSLRRLPVHVQKRIEEPAFYETLQRAVASKFARSSWPPAHHQDSDEPGLVTTQSA